MKLQSLTHHIHEFLGLLFSRSPLPLTPLTLTLLPWLGPCFSLIRNSTPPPPDTFHKESTQPRHFTGLVVLTQVVLHRGPFCTPRRHSVVSGDISGCHSWRRLASSIYWVDARAAPPAPPRQRMTQPPISTVVTLRNFTLTEDVKVTVLVALLSPWVSAISMTSPSPFPLFPPLFPSLWLLRSQIPLPVSGSTIQQSSLVVKSSLVIQICLWSLIPSIKQLINLFLPNTMLS